jgi:hypothetical protein
MMPQTAPLGQARGKLISSSKRTACPVCDRRHDGSCRIGTNFVLCWRGTSHAPPEWARIPKDHGIGADGQEWAYLGDCDGWAKFKPHQPLGHQERRKLVKRTVPVRPRWADGGEVEAFWTEEPEAGSYRPDHWIVAALYQRHCLAMGWEVAL